jgi:twinkle protein
MATLADKLRERGFQLKSFANGDHKITCPECSHTRSKHKDACLSLKLDDEGATWLCHHCDWPGAVGERDDRPAPRERRLRRAPPVKPSRKPGELTPDGLAWLAARGISEATARRNRIGCERAFMPGLDMEVDCLAFPYWRGGELVNIKFRTIEGKHFRLRWHLVHVAGDSRDAEKPG